MLRLSEILQKLYLPFLGLDCDVYHFKRHGSSLPYVVWAEEGEEDSLHTNNIKSEQQLVGTVELYTKTEFDALADDIQDILQEEGIGWQLTNVLYEDETALIHYPWRWWVS